MIHIIVGDEAAKNLEAAFELDENLKGEIVVLKDTLGIGPIALQEEERHNAVRTEFWKTINPTFEGSVEDENTIKILVTKAVREEEPLCFWMSPCVSDVCAYYWLLPYCKPHVELLHTISIVGLPFLNEKGQLFYPSNFSEVPAKEFIKTKRLLKEVTPAEYEVDGDEWKKLQDDTTWVRIYEGGKKIASKEVTHFDTLLKNSVTNDFQKGQKVVNETLKKTNQTVSDLFIAWRLRELIAQEVFIINGDASKALKDFEVKKNSQEETMSDD
jgi:hypothetical protein